MIKKLFRKLFKKRTIISFKQGFDLTDMPVITLYQGEKRFNFLLDTGSNHSIIDLNILDEIEHEKTEEVTGLFGMEGHTKESCVCRISLYYKEKEYNFPYLIADMKEAFTKIKQETGVTLHGLIGSKFFNKYKYVLDFDELIAYSKA